MAVRFLPPTAKHTLIAETAEAVRDLEVKKGRPNRVAIFEPQYPDVIPILNDDGSPVIDANGDEAVHIVPRQKAVLTGPHVDLHDRHLNEMRRIDSQICVEERRPRRGWGRVPGLSRIPRVGYTITRRDIRNSEVQDQLRDEEARFYRLLQERPNDEDFPTKNPGPTRPIRPARS